MAKQKLAKQKVTFTYVAPTAQAVLLAGDFTGWKEAPVSLKKSKEGVWTGTVSLSPGRYQYRMLVDGQWFDDPLCSERQSNEFGGQNCVCVVNGNS
jgi:1,4-alpha-glucan branching enzyme